MSQYHMLSPEVLTQIAQRDISFKSIQLYIFTSVDENAYKEGPPLVFVYDTSQTDGDFRITGTKVHSFGQRIKDWLSPRGQVQRGQNFQRIKRSIVLQHKTPVIISHDSQNRNIIFVDVGNGITLRFYHFKPTTAFANGGYRLADFTIEQNGIVYETKNGAYLFYDEKDLNNVANTVSTEEILPGQRVEEH